MCSSRTWLIILNHDAKPDMGSESVSIFHQCHIPTMRCVSNQLIKSWRLCGANYYTNWTEHAYIHNRWALLCGHKWVNLSRILRPNASFCSHATGTQCLFSKLFLIIACCMLNINFPSRSQYCFEHAIKVITYYALELCSNWDMLWSIWPINSAILAWMRDRSTMEVWLSLTHNIHFSEAHYGAFVTD